MRMLFITGGGQATVFSLAPLATAVRGAGHEVFMAANRDLMPAVTATGLPAIAVTELPVRHFVSRDRQGRAVSPPTNLDLAQQGRFTGRWFARMAAACLPSLREFVKEWRPDVIVGGTMSYAANLLARHLDVPFVRLAWDAIDADHIHPGADEELQEELRELGLDRLPEPDLFIDVCPPSLRPAGAAAATPMRYIPGNRQQPLEPWMYTRGSQRRVLVTAGSQVTRDGAHQLFEFLAHTVREVADTGTEVLIAAPNELAGDLREVCGEEVRAGWVPLDIVAPTCDLIVHHGGGVTSLTGVHAGTPQVIAPGARMLVAPAQRLADYGAAVRLPMGEAPDTVGATCRKVLGAESYAERARTLREEMAAMPSPNATVSALEAVVRS